MSYFIIVLCLITTPVYSASVNNVRTYDGYKEYEVTGDKSSIDKFEEIFSGLDEPFYYKRYSARILQAIVPPQMVAKFEETASKLQLKTEVIFHDVAQIIRLEKESPTRRNTFSWNSYYDIDDIYGFVQNMSATYPDWTELVVGGESYEGRQIKGLRINTPQGRAEGKPAMFVESGIHAREWITPATITYFINQLLTSDNPDIVAMRDQFDWHIFPSVNPDGYHYSYTVDRMWRKTRSKSPSGCYGADPNRNWDYNWLQHGANNRSCDYQVYGGSKPFSEVETRSLSAYISGIENLLGYIAFHADAQMLLLPYSDSEEHSDNYDDLVKIGTKSLEYGYKVNRAKYDGPATAAELLWYSFQVVPLPAYLDLMMEYEGNRGQPSNFIGTDKASGGSMDWVRYALGTPLVYTYELRGYYFHWPPHLIYQQGDEVTQMMLGLVQGSKDLGYYK